jgi:hypothetical protein
MFYLRPPGVVGIRPIRVTIGGRYEKVFAYIVHLVAIVGIG